jgi:hypothetical protein
MAPAKSGWSTIKKVEEAVAFQIRRFDATL